MRTFFVAILLFLILLCAIWINYLFINTLADDLERSIDALPPCEQAQEACGALFAYWEEKSSYAGLSVSFEVIYELSENLADLYSAAKCNEPSDFDAARERARISIRQLRRLERIDLENIF